MTEFTGNPFKATGFRSWTFHPKYIQNGLFFTTHNEQAGTVQAFMPYLIVRIQTIDNQGEQYLLTKGNSAVYKIIDCQESSISLSSGKWFLSSKVK